MVFKKNAYRLSLEIKVQEIQVAKEQIKQAYVHFKQNLSLLESKAVAYPASPPQSPFSAILLGLRDSILTPLPPVCIWNQYICEAFFADEVQLEDVLEVWQPARLTHTAPLN